MLNNLTRHQPIILFIAFWIITLLNTTIIHAQTFNPSNVHPRAMNDVLYTFDDTDVIFSAPGAYGTHDVAWGDMDGDGDLDLAVANGADNTALQSSINRIYRNEGEYNFTIEDLNADNSSYSTSLSWGDADGDGDLDLAVGNLDSVNRLYLNNGRGSFTPQDLPESIDQTRSIAWGDADGDGDLDLAVGNEGAANQLLVNDGEGNFVAENINEELLETYTVSWGDADQDGDLDLAVGNSLAINQLFINDGSAAFTMQTLGNDAQDTRDIAWGDMDNDGYLDLVIGNAMGMSNLLINQGSNFFKTIDLEGFRSITVGGYSLEDYLNTGDTTTSNVQIRDVELADIDGDSDLDILFADTNGPVHIWLHSYTGNIAWDLFDLGLDSQGDRLFIVYNFHMSDGRGSHAIAMADMDNDGDLDAAEGNGGVNRILTNVFSDKFTVQTLDPDALVADVAWGDMDHDGDMDLAVARTKAPNQIYKNDGHGTLTPMILDSQILTTEAIAWGDMDGDNDLDLAVVNETISNRIYRNDGNDIFTAIEIDAPLLSSNSVNWGDMDDDGDLDLVVGNLAGVDQLYRNEGDATFTIIDLNTETFETGDVAWGDMDKDGDLDIAIANLGQPNYLYRNEGNEIFTPIQLDGTTLFSNGVAWGDMDNDGDLDLIFGNIGDINQLYHNDGQGNFTEAFLDDASDLTYDITWLEIDGDGDLDLLTGDSGYPQLYQNHNAQFLNNRLRTLPPNRGHGLDGLKKVSWGDMDNDGDLDLAIGTEPLNGNTVSDQVGLHIFENVRQGNGNLPNNPPYLEIMRPIDAPSTNTYVPTDIVSNTIIPISFTLYDKESDPVATIEITYSLNDGTGWHRAMPTADTQTVNLATSPNGEKYVFQWDTFASEFFGQSDNVVLRMMAYEQLGDPASKATFRYVNNTPGPYQRPASVALTEPFRARGTQIRISNENGPISEAIVYRLPAGHEGKCGSEGKGNVVAAITNVPYRTQTDGYLAGRGQIGINDCLIALHPIEKKPKYTVYHTNARPISSGLESFVVESPGIQELTVSASNALIVFDLDISLEWDARSETEYLTELELNLKYASELLFDWSNGQVALGDLTIYQNKEQWHEADIRVHASNVLRPHATIGGVLDSIETELDFVNGATITNTYGPGSVKMGKTWNRFNEPDIKQNKDWSSALAHELGHYLFFLYDNYIGFKDDQTVHIYGCPGVMSNPYENADSEFHPQLRWEEDCAHTLSHQKVGRSDWESIMKRYEWLQAPDSTIDDIQIAGPDNLPLKMTKVLYAAPKRGRTTLELPIYSLYNENSQPYQAGPGARAILFKKDRLLDLGVPTSTITAHGREAGDGICVYELDAQPEPLIGCEIATLGDSSITMMAVSQWQPDLTITPITVTLQATQLMVRVENLADALNPKMRIYPKDNLPGQELPPIVDLNPNGDGSYSTEVTLGPLMREAYIHLFEGDNPYGPHNTIADYTIGGEPVFLFGNGNVIEFTDGATLVTESGEVIQLGAGDLLSLSEGNVLIRLADGSVQTLTDGETLSLSDGNTLSLSDGNTLSLSDGDTLSLSDGNVLVTTNGETLSLSDGDTLSLSDGNALVLTEGFATIWLQNGETLSLSDGNTLSLSDGNTLSLSDGNTLSLSDGNTLSLSDGNVQLIGLGETPGIGNAPLRSNDNQVTIFADQGQFEAGQFYIVQSTTVLPNIPNWATPLGKGYRIESSPNAPDLTNATLTIGYSGRDIDNDKEKFIRLYYRGENERWVQISTEEDVNQEQNVVWARPQGPGVYALMYSILEQPMSVGWQFFTYPSIATEGSIQEALGSIDGAYATIYQYDALSPNPLARWRVYDVDAPSWANTISQMMPGSSYIISMTQASTLKIKGGSSGLARTRPRSSQNIFDFPSSFYGTVAPELNLTANVAVQADINGTLCGESQGREVDGQIVYSMIVVGEDTVPGCGKNGEKMNIVAGNNILIAEGTWHRGSVQPVGEDVPMTTPTLTPIATITTVSTETPEPTSTSVPTEMATPTATEMATTTSEPTPTVATPLPTEIPTEIPTPEPTVTNTPTSTIAATHQPTIPPTNTPVPTATSMSTMTATPLPTVTNPPTAPEPAETPLPTVTAIPTTASEPIDTATLTPTSEFTATSAPDMIATPSPTVTVTTTPESTATSIPSATATPQATVTPTTMPEPTATNMTIPIMTATPQPSVTVTITLEPTTAAIPSVTATPQSAVTPTDVNMSTPEVDSKSTEIINVYLPFVSQ